MNTTPDKTTTLYVSPYTTVNNTNISKHYYAGSERLMTNTGRSPILGISTHLGTAAQLIAKRNAQRNLLSRIATNCWNKTYNYSRDQLSYLTATTTNAYAAYYYHTDHLGSSSWISNSSGAAQQYLVYLPFGETLLDRCANTNWNTMFSFSGKERDSETGYSYFGARYYDAGTSIWLSVDPMADKYPGVSPYTYCSNNPINRVDPDGRMDNPIYDYEGNFLGTDDRGLQGKAIIMNRLDFKQGMSHESAMSVGSTLDNMSNADAMKFANNDNFSDFLSHYNSLSSRPDWDGYLTLAEANDWYRNGNGQPLFADLSKIDMSGIRSLGKKYVGQQKVVNLLFDGNSLNDGLVYGQITLKRYPNHQVRAYADEYNFEMHNGWDPLNWTRNAQTSIGSRVAGQGTKYEINLYGSKTLKPLFPWIK